MTTVHVLTSGSRELTFVIRASDGATLATSSPFATICRLEAGLGALSAAARGTWRLEWKEGMTVLIVASRRRVQVTGNLGERDVQTILKEAATATIVDERPPSRRRQDLSGLGCDLKQ